MPDACVPFVRDLHDRLARFLVRLHADDDVPLVANDARFHARNVPHGVAEEFLVVEVEGRDDREEGPRGGDDVGRVLGAAHADFDDGEVDGWGRGGKEGEGRRGQDFETGRVDVFPLGSELDSVFCGAEHVFVDGTAVQVDTVPLVDEVGAVEPRGGDPAPVLQDGREVRRDGTFAVGAGDVDYGGRVVRRAEGGEQAVDAG